MKLARVDHIRCHERGINDPETFVWVDDAMTEDEFCGFVQAARNAYDQAGKDFQESDRPPGVSWAPNYEAYPTLTIAEVKAIHEDAKAKYGAWEQRKREAQKSFAYHLKQVGNGRIELFYNVKPQIVQELDWGHRHSQTIAYGETKFRELPGTVPHESPY